MHKHTDVELDPRFEEARGHMKAARTAFRSSVEALLPPGFIEGRRKARREMLLAVRSLMDAAIEHMDKAVKSEETKA